MDVFRARGVLCAHKTQIPNEVFVCDGTPRVNLPNLDVSMSGNMYTNFSINVICFKIVKINHYQFQGAELY